MRKTASFVDFQALLGNFWPLFGHFEVVFLPFSSCFRRSQAISSLCKVTFAESTLASAALLFKQQDEQREICIVNCGSGHMPPADSFTQVPRKAVSDPFFMVDLHHFWYLFAIFPSFLASFPTVLHRFASFSMSFAAFLWCVAPRRRSSTAKRPRSWPP